MKRLVAIFILLALSGTAIGQTLPEHTLLGYGEYKIDVDIDSGDLEIFISHLKAGDKLEVELEVVDGGSVDFFLMDNYTAYQTYVSGGTELAYLAAPYSRLSSTEISYTHTNKLDDSVFVVIDNAALTENGASPDGNVTVQGKINVKKNVWTLQNILILIVLIVAIIVTFAKFTYRPKKKK